MSRYICFVIVLVAGLSALSVAATPPDEQEIDRLIHQLGSGKFAEREAAQKALGSAGPGALEKLRVAASSADPEISRRAKELIPLVERRAETAQALTAKRFSFRVKDMTVPDAVRELAKQSSVTVALTGDPSALADQKITLETPELTFWEVLDRFSAAAGLIEARTQTAPGSRGNAVQLAAGKPSAVPTAHAGALRLRALPPTAEEKPGQGEVIVNVEARLEPQLGWRSRPRVRIDEALDDKNQALALVTAEETNPAQVEQVIRGQQIVIQQRAVVIGGGNRVIFDDVGGAYMPGENTYRLPVRLKLPDEPGQSLKSLRGLLTGDLPLPAEELLAIENILDVPNSGKKSFKGKGDLAVTITAVTLRDDGTVKVTFEMSGEHNLANAGMPVQAIRGGRGQLQFEMPAEGVQIRLLDADGKAYRLTGSSNTMQVNNGQVANNRMYTFSPPTEKSSAKKFVISGSRLAKIEVPFVLKDVPLGK